MITMLIVIFINIAIPVCVGMYVYQDAKNRGMEAILWTAVAVLIPYFIGLLIYLVVRYNHAAHKCYRCGASVKDTYTLCPQCGAELKAKCPNCGAYIEPDWHLCAHCGTELPYYEPYAQAEQPSGFNSKVIVKGLIISAIIAIVIALLLGIAMGSFFLIPAQMHGINIMHHL